MKSDIARLTSRAEVAPVAKLERSATLPKKGGIPWKKTYILAAAVFLIAVTVTAILLIAPQESNPPDGEVSPAPPPTPELTLLLPTPYFAVEASRVIETEVHDRTRFLSLIEDSLKEPEREGDIKRIAVKILDVGEARFATAQDLLSFYLIQPPVKFLERLEEPLMLFIFYGSGGGRLGLAIKTRDPDRTLRDMLSWEPTLFNDLRPLFSHVKLKSEVTKIPFEDRTYRNIDWRYLKISPEEDLGIAYTIFPAEKLLVLATSKLAIEKVIDRLFGPE